MTEPLRAATEEELAERAEYRRQLAERAAAARAAYDKARGEQAKLENEDRRRERERVLAEHRALVAAATGLRAAVLILHGPHPESGYTTDMVCRGCEGGDFDADYPCSSYDLARNWDNDTQHLNPPRKQPPLDQVAELPSVPSAWPEGGELLDSWVGTQVMRYDCDQVTLHQASFSSPQGHIPERMLGLTLSTHQIRQPGTVAILVTETRVYQGAYWWKGKMIWAGEPGIAPAGTELIFGPFPLEVTFTTA